MLISVDTRLLHLTRIDDDIYCKFRLEFPDIAISLIEEATLKSEVAKVVSITANIGFEFQFTSMYL